ncbi:MAG: M23 family metallopeptidase [Wenzhouxiangellaceae bacterium]
MRDRQLITITDCHGARHYTLSQLMRRWIVGIAASIGILVMAGSLILYVMTNKVGDLKSQLADLQQYHNDIEANNDRLLAEQRRLLSAVREKSDELSLLSDEVGQIEMLIGLRPEPGTNLYERIDTASQTALEKRLMLQSIPSSYPVEKRIITSKYGMRTHPVRDEEAFHWGADLKAERGTPVYATADGAVEWAALHKGSGLGKMVKISHNYGFSTIYGHLNDIEVKAGQYVRQGDLLGYSGSTGMTNGPHLHYEVRYLQRRLDPAPFLEWSLDNYDTLFAREERVQWESLAKVVRRTASVPERRLSQREQTSLAASP